MRKSGDSNAGAGEAPVRLRTCRDRAKCSWHRDCERVVEKGVAWNSAGKSGWRNVTLEREHNVEEKGKMRRQL